MHPWLVGSQSSVGCQDSAGPACYPKPFGRTKGKGGRPTKCGHHLGPAILGASFAPAGALTALDDTHTDRVPRASQFEGAARPRTRRHARAHHAPTFHEDRAARHSGVLEHEGRLAQPQAGLARRIADRDRSGAGECHQTHGWPVKKGGFGDTRRPRFVTQRNSVALKRGTNAARMALAEAMHVLFEGLPDIHDPSAAS